MRCAILLTLIAASTLPAADRVLFDFESGDWTGWHVEGKGFGDKPFDAESTVPGYPWHRTFGGWRGRYMVIVGDTRHGVVPPSRLTSEEFTIDRPYLKFRFGGEVHPRVRVALLVDGREARVAYGNNSYDMRERGWDVRDFRGRPARLLIVDEAEVHSLVRLDQFVLSDDPPPVAGSIDDHPQESPIVRYGEFRLAYDAGPGQIFEHTSIVNGPDRRWHVYASAVASEERWTPAARRRIVHLSAHSLNGHWRAEPDALTLSAVDREDFLMEPFVIIHNGLWHMFYVGSGVPWKGWDKNNNWQKKDFGAASTQGPYNIHLATSRDGVKWQRRGIVVTDTPFAFTPFVTRIGSEWVMYYASAEPASIMGKHAIVARTSKDLRTWSDRRIVLVDTTNTTPWPEHSFFHSPLVFERAGKWFLLAGPIDNGNQSRFHYRRLFLSDNPFRFSLDRHEKGLFLEGGAKLIREGAQDYVTHSGTYAGGLWIAPVRWAAH